MHQAGFAQRFCPPITHHPCFETHVQPLQVINRHQQPSLFLATSTELNLKQLFFQAQEQGEKGCFSLDFVFRDDPRGDYHRSQFLMLEWYQYQGKIQDLKKICQQILELVYTHFPKELNPKLLNSPQEIKAYSLIELFRSHCSIDLETVRSCEHFDQLAFTFLNQRQLLSLKTTELYHQKKLSSSDLFNFIFINQIEPIINSELGAFIFLTDYPHLAGGIAKQNQAFSFLSERVEFFILGTEIANGCNEETNRSYIEERINQQLEEKINFYQTEIAAPVDFYLAHNSLPSDFSYAGMALGVERMLTVMLGKSCFLSNI